MNQQKCIDDEVLAAYFDGLLTDEQEEALLRQALTCERCQDALAAVAIIVNESDFMPASFHVPDAITASAVDLFDRRQTSESMYTIAIKWLEGALAPLKEGLSPDYQVSPLTRGAAIESVERFDELRFNVTLGNCPLVIDLEVDGPDELALSIKPVNPIPPGTLLRLSCQGETKAISALAPEGATVSSLPPGRYDLSLEQSNKMMGQMAIELVR